MPLDVKPPRAGKSPNWTIRGTYLGVHVDRSAGTTRRAVAVKVMRAIEEEIERGAFARPAVAEPTFLDAAVSYMASTGQRAFLRPLVEELGRLPLPAITQAVLDAAAVSLYPNASPATRNRQVYTPVSAILRHAGVETRFRRPKGWRGKVETTWLKPEQANAYVEAAWALDSDFGDLCFFAIATGVRRSEAQRLTGRDLWLREAYALIGETKNGEPRAMHLPPPVVAMLANREIEDDELVFGLSMTTLKRRVKALKAELPWLPDRPLHALRHTWGAWMRRYGRLDDEALLGTRAWKSRESMSRYLHADVSESARAADRLPLPSRGKSVENAVSRRKA